MMPLRTMPNAAPAPPTISHIAGRDRGTPTRQSPKLLQRVRSPGNQGGRNGQSEPRPWPFKIAFRLGPSGSNSVPLGLLEHLFETQPACGGRLPSKKKTGARDPVGCD